MSRAAFRKADIERAIAAAKAAGLEVAGVDFFVEERRFRVVTVGGRDLTGDTEEQKLDRELDEHRRRRGYGSA